jgi:SAM-dependent methyltransferase
MPAEKKETPPVGPLATPEPWDLVSDRYTEHLIPQFSLFSEDALRLADLPPKASVLDVATGPGTLALLAASRGARVCALDFSEAMIRNLKRRAAEQGIPDLDIRLGDGQSLPFADNAFDGAFSMFGLMFFPDRGKGFRELLRALRPGGRAVVSAWAPMDGPFAVMSEAMREALPFLPPPTGKPPLGDPDSFRLEMETAGFRNVAIEETAHPFKSDSTREFWDRVQATTAPVVLLRKKVGEEKWSEASARVLERMRRELGDGPQTMSGRAFLGVGTK